MAITRADSQLADQTMQELAQSYRITVLKDWGEQEADTTASWQGGEWSLEELDILKDAIADLANAMGGADSFTNKIDAITISQVQTKYRGLATKRDIKFTASPVSIDKWTVVHELGHVWDAHNRWRLSKALQAYTGGHTSWMTMLMKRRRGECDAERRWPGCNRFGYFYAGPPPAGSDQNLNCKEDFAESVAAYVYSDVARARVERFRESELYRDILYYEDYTQTRRWAFVRDLINGDIVV